MYRPSFTFKTITGRLISLTLFIFMSWTIAGAYTLVFYGGKRIEVPDNFTVTSDAVIYETAPGVNVSFRLNSIDVVATERANNGSPGSLLRRIGAERLQVQTSTSKKQKATRTITNRDLEPFERARLQSEVDWDKRSKELGLPSLDETRREAARRDAALDEFLGRKRLQAETNYWHEREAELRAAATLQMNTNDYQGGQNYWPNGSVLDNGGFGQFDSRFRFGQGFPGRLNQGSPCGFNPSPACLSTHPFSLFNSGGFPRHRSIFVAPSTNGRAGRGRGVFVSPGRRH
ncbi:MAG TPA: hypothetical protein VI306_24510 [Pyrinomonadaceae bacterium]